MQNIIFRPFLPFGHCRADNIDDGKPFVSPQRHSFQLGPMSAVLQIAVIDCSEAVRKGGIDVPSFPPTTSLATRYQW